MASMRKKDHLHIYR